MKLTTKTENNLLIIALEGRLDATNAEETLGKIKKEIDKGYNQLTLDLSKMDYLSSAGIRVLITVLKKIKSLNGEMKLAALQDYPKNVLKISGFLKIFDIYEDKSGALQSFQSRANKKQPSATTEQITRENLTFQIQAADPQPASLTVLGNYQTFLRAECVPSNLITYPISAIRHSLGMGAIGEEKTTSLDHIGEMMLVNGTAIWMEPEDKNIPDYLAPVDAENKIDLHTPFHIILDDHFNDILRFEANDLDKGISLKEIYTKLLSIAAQRTPNFKGIISCLIRADVHSVYGVALKRSPQIANKPGNSSEILSGDNIRKWLQYNIDAAFEDTSALITGVGLARNHDFPAEQVANMFKQDNDSIAIHNHGAIFDFIPEERNTFDLKLEIQKVLKNAELTGMQHLLENTHLKKGIIGLNYIETIANKSF
ncbi:MAG: STAS domain-containing protein [Fidelibacterota bacterium]